MKRILRATLGGVGLMVALNASVAQAGTFFRLFGDADLVGFGFPAGVTPTDGAATVGLVAGQVSFATGIYGHGFPFSPGVGEFPGTDQIYVGSTQTGFHDGYSSVDGRMAGPQVLTLDLTGLVPAGEAVETLTLGIAADDFQNRVAGQPFTVSINGIPSDLLTGVINSLDQTTPVEQYISFGLPISDFVGNSLVVTIDEGGDGGDGWSVDYLTLGVTTVVPEPGVVGFGAAVGVGALLRRRRVG